MLLQFKHRTGICIVGEGSTFCYLAQTLSKMNEVTALSNRSEELKHLRNYHDLKTVQVDPRDPELFDELKGHSNLFIFCTADNAVNILLAQLAQKQGADKTVTIIRGDGFERREKSINKTANCSLEINISGLTAEDILLKSGLPRELTCFPEADLSLFRLFVQKTKQKKVLPLEELGLGDTLRPLFYVTREDQLIFCSPERGEDPQPENVEAVFFLLSSAAKRHLYHRYRSRRYLIAGEMSLIPVLMRKLEPFNSHTRIVIPKDADSSKQLTGAVTIQGNLFDPDLWDEDLIFPPSESRHNLVNIFAPTSPERAFWLGAFAGWKKNGAILVLPDFRQARFFRDSLSNDILLVNPPLLIWKALSRYLAETQMPMHPLWPSQLTVKTYHVQSSSKMRGRNRTEIAETLVSHLSGLKHHHFAVRILGSGKHLSPRRQQAREGDRLLLFCRKNIEEQISSLLGT